MITLFLIGLAAAGATAIGGLFALRFKDRLHLIVGFSAGAVLGVAFFDLMPEAFNLVGSVEPSFVTTVIAIGFLIYMVIDRVLTLHMGSGDDHEGHHHSGTVGTLSLSIHSFLDGVGIGFAFQVSNALGIVVTLAVLAHDFSDGINTVNLSLLSGGSRKRAGLWLLADAIAPIAGIATSLFFAISQSALGILIALFTGFFLYIGAAELVPESHHRHPHVWTTVMTLVGAGILYLVIHSVGL
jgi:ZIP family zinc transporter